MKTTSLLCLLLLILGGCKHKEVAPGTYLKPLFLILEPQKDGISLKWNPAFYLEEGMYPGPTPVAPAQYEVYLSESGPTALRKIAVIDGNIREYVMSGQPEGKTIHVQVKAIHPRLVTSESNVATTNTGQLGMAQLLFSDNTPNVTFGSWGGSSLVYAGENGMWTIRSADGTQRQLKNQGYQPVLSPDGRYVAYVANKNTNTSYSTQLFVQTVESGVVRLLDTQQAIFAVEWSNDGQWLAYIAIAQGQSKSVWKRSVVDDRRIFLYTPVAGLGQLNDTQIDWSPDDTYVCVSRERTVPLVNRYVTNLLGIPANGGEPQSILASDYRDDQPAFSPDGQYLAFISDRSGYRAVWVMNRRTGKLQQVTGVLELFYYINRLDWMNNKALTYTTYQSASVGSSLRRVTLPD